jgi:WSTF, HB1, Itc1p, MBD9 motif 1
MTFQHATTATFPRLQKILTQLLFAPDLSAEHSLSTDSSRLSSPGSRGLQGEGSTPAVGDDADKNQATDQIDTARDSPSHPPTSHTASTSKSSQPFDAAKSPPARISYTSSSPGERYHALPAADRIAILSFMCDLAISSKAIHAHMESCEEQLTALRKEKIEVNRMKKQM